MRCGLGPRGTSSDDCSSENDQRTNLKKGKKVYDLGCGDGRLVIGAAKIAGVTGVGFEISPPVYLLAFIFRNLLNGFIATIYFKSFWNKDLSDADVVFLYLLPKAMKKLVEKFNKELKKEHSLFLMLFN